MSDQAGVFNGIRVKIGSITRIAGAVVPAEHVVIVVHNHEVAKPEDGWVKTDRGFYEMIVPISDVVVESGDDADDVPPPDGVF